MTPLQLEASKAHERGWLLTPLDGKKPIQNGWPTAAAPTLEQLMEWAEWYNLGLRTGEASGLFVVDFDKPSEEDPLLASMPRTPTVRTGGGGLHFYLRLVPGFKNWVGKLAKHVDIRTTGGQVVYVGSTHPNGTVYRWEVSPDEAELAEPPQLLLDLAAQLAPPPEVERRQVPTIVRPHGSRYLDTALQRECDAVASAPRSQRHATLNRASFNLGQLVGPQGLDYETTRAALSASASHLQEEGRSREVERTIRDGLAAGMLRPRPVPVPRLQPVNADGSLPEVEPEYVSTVPEILIPGGYTDQQGEYHEIGNDDFARDVLDNLPPGLLYRRADRVGMLDGEPGSVTFRPLVHADMRLLVDAYIRLVKWVKPRGSTLPKLVYQNCSNDHAGLLLSAAASHGNVRDLVSLTSYPVFLGPTVELAEPGWNAQHGVYYDEPPALRSLPQIDDQERITTILEDLTTDFPFKNEASRHNFYGLLLTPLLRPAIDGNVPMHMVLASLERTGKTKLVEEVLGGVILGRPADATQLAPREEEREKRILALLRRGDTVLHLDNVRDFVDSPSLASLLTSTSFSGRVLGVTEMASVRNGLTVVATGNNVRATGEIVKRTVPIQLQPLTDSPEDRTDFKHPDLRGYVSQNRAQILGALIGLVERWRAGTRWLYPRPIGGYERWTALVGGILKEGLYTEWLGNYREWVRTSDPWSEDARQLLDAWVVRYPDSKVYAKDLLALATDQGIFPHVFKANGEHGKVMSFSRSVLSKLRDQPVGAYVVRATGSGSNSLYYLEPLQ